MALVFKADFLREQKGLTLIELVLVIFTLGLLAALVFPNAVDIINNHRLESTAKEIVSDLRVAQQMAISREKFFRVIMNDESPATNPKNIYYIKEVNGPTIKTVKLPANITFYVSHVFDFSYTGETLNRTIQLVNKRTNKSKFIIIFSTGRIRISDTPPS